MKLNANGGYMLETRSFCLEVLGEEEIDALIKYIIREEEVICTGWFRKYISIDTLLADYFLYLASDKLEEYQYKLMDEPLTFNEEEQQTYDWLKAELKRSIEPYTTWEKKQEEFREKAKSERRLRGIFQSAAFSTDPEVAARLAKEAETEGERDFYNCVLRINKRIKNK